MTSRSWMMFVPGVLVGGLLFGSAFVHASAGSSEDEVWPAGGGDVVHVVPARRVAEGPRTPPVPPRPPAPPAPGSPVTPPTPPTPPPTRRSAGGRQISVSVKDGKIQIRGIDEFARQQIENVRQMLRSNPNIPADVRDRVFARMDRARAALNRRLQNLSVDDLDNLDSEMEKMSDELEKAFEGLEEDLDKLGDKMGKDLAKKFGKDMAKQFKPGKFQFDFHGNDPPEPGEPAEEDDDNDSGGMPTPDVEITNGPNVTDVQDLKGIALKPDQRDRIVRLRKQLDRDVTTAQKQLEDASQRLEVALAKDDITDQDISRYVDQISAHEAAIRKARLLTWVQARRVLDAGQRKKIEDASHKRHK